jgi:hypothetical protein
MSTPASVTASYDIIPPPLELFQHSSLNPPSSYGAVVPQVFVGMDVGTEVVSEAPSVLALTAAVFVHEFRRYKSLEAPCNITQFDVFPAPKQTPA